ncbi:hypothetical protein [Treponema sp.]|uniref:hypothetical protein n=1 Tax=Treponema sp. TaxID=166 RepID=UPI003F0ECBF9
MKLKFFVFLLPVFLLCAAPCAFFAEEPEVRHNPWSLIIYRPENSWHINEVRCYLRLEDALTGEDVTYKNAKANYSWMSEPKKGIPYERSYYLSGGMAMHLLLKSGKYKIYFYTPKEKLAGLVTEKELARKDWRSNVFLYDTENPARVIFVSPCADENGFYTGAWNISGKAPLFWKFTKPVPAEAD